MARLGDIATLITKGTTPTSIGFNFQKEGINFVKLESVDDKGCFICDKFDHISDECHEKLKRSQLQENDILFSIAGAIGRAAIVKKDILPANTNQALAIIRIPQGAINYSFLLYVLQSSAVLEQAEKKKQGVAQLNLSLKDIGDFVIPDLHLEKQQEIVDNLDKVSTLISFRKQQLSKLDELVKSRFIELFGDTGKQVPLVDYVWFQEGPGVRSVDFTDEGTILLTGSNINDNTISFGYKSDRHISNELASGKYAHFMCDKDDILVVSSAIDPDKFDKKVVVVDVDKKYCLNTGIIRFKPNKQFLTLGYFREFLKTDYFKHQVSSEMRGIAQMHFGPSHLKQMTILLPDSIERQVEFEAFVQQTDKSKFAIQQSLEKLETLKKALMQQYFG